MSIDLWITIAVMSLLFLRHTAVYKDPTKINYTPVVLALGVIGALLHFILSDTFELNVIKESLLSLSVGVLLSAIMSVMNQTVSVINAHAERLKLSQIGDDVTVLNTSLSHLQERLDAVAQMENSTHEEVRRIFKEELETLGLIQSNQRLFIAKLEALLIQQQTGLAKFEEFTLSELPSLDNVVHRHIDLLRVAEQDHFNHMKNILQSSANEQKEFHDHLKELHALITKSLHHQLPEHIIAVLHKELDRIVHDFAHHLQLLGGKTESIVASLLENDALLRGTREQSELIMQQMVLSGKQMKELSSHSKELSESLSPLSHLFASAQSLHGEFLHAKGALSELIVTLESYERQEFRAIRQNLEQVAAEATAQMQLFIQQIQSHETASRESQPMIGAKNVQELASKVKLNKSYLGEIQE